MLSILTYLARRPWVQVGKDPQARQYHFPYRAYHANQQVMNALRACDELSELYAWLKQLGADGGLAAHVEQASGKVCGGWASGRRWEEGVPGRHVCRLAGRWPACLLERPT